MKANEIRNLRPVLPAVRNLDSQSSNRGSTPLRAMIEELLEKVLDKPFEVCWCGDAWCQFNEYGIPKLHLTDEGGRDYVAQVALHEAAHLQMKRGGHDVLFWEYFEQLLLKYLNTTLNSHQSKMKSDYLGFVFHLL